MLKNKVTILLLVSLLVSYTASMVRAEQLLSDNAQIIQIAYEPINPGDGFKFSFKRLREKVMLALVSFSSQSKYNYQKDLLNKRLAELKYVVDNKDIANIQTTSQRYSATAGQITELVINNDLDKRDIRNIFSSQLQVLKDIQKQFNDTTAEWRFIEHDIDYIKSYISQLN